MSRVDNVKKTELANVKTARNGKTLARKLGHFEREGGIDANGLPTELIGSPRER